MKSTLVWLRWIHGQDISFGCQSAPALRFTGDLNEIKNKLPKESEQTGAKTKGSVWASLKNRTGLK